MEDNRVLPKYATVKTSAGDYKQPPFVTQQLYESAVSYKPEKSDIYVATFPKNGTTWMLYILHMLHERSTEFEEGDSIFSKYACLDFIGAEKTKDFPIKPRLVQSHFYYEFAPWNDETKYIFVARNPKDVVVSFFYHTVGFPFYEFKEGKFDDYFELFINGQVDFGDYFKMVPEWWEQSKKKKNIHFVLYENLKTNFEEEILKIADFLDNGIKVKLMKDNKNLLKQISEKANIMSVKNDKSMVVTRTDFKRLESLPFARKGIIGDWKSMLSRKQSEMIDEKMKNAAVKHPGFDKLWDEYKEYL